MRSFEGDRNFNQQHKNVSQRIKENGTAVNNFREIMRNNVKKEENSESASSRKGLSTISHKEQKRVAVKSDSGKRFEDCYDDKERPKERYSSLPGSTAIFKLNVGHLTLGKDAGNAKMSRELESTESDQKTGNHRIRTSRNAPFGKSITKNAKKFSGDRYCLGKF